ncbi:Protein yipf5 [Lobulomyces angularis]|nr:Protein yipf5 [Lobulomyces angularis]
MYSQLNQSNLHDYSTGNTNLEFQSFNYDQTSNLQQQQQYSYTHQPQPNYIQQNNQFSEVSFQSIKSAFSTGGYANEPPLLEELGINFDHIKTKTVSVLNPFKVIDKNIMDDTDLAGPLFFIFLFGGFLLFSGKVNFGYIYGLAVLGWLSIYTILNLMSEHGIDIYKTASVLGYCLLPMIILSILTFLSFGRNELGLKIISILSVYWCTHSASLMFVTVLSMSNQRLLVAYPVGLLYSAFAILAIF